MSAWILVLGVSTPEKKIRKNVFIGTEMLNTVKSGMYVMDTGPQGMFFQNMVQYMELLCTQLTSSLFWLTPETTFSIKASGNMLHSLFWDMEVN